jgi:hypothetical protein
MTDSETARREHHRARREAQQPINAPAAGGIPYLPGL